MPYPSPAVYSKDSPSGLVAQGAALWTKWDGQPLTGRLTHRLNAALDRVLPEQRLFLRSDTDTRFVRLSPLTQATILGVSALVVAWTILATAVLVVDQLGASSAQTQMLQDQATYEARLNALSHERDLRAQEAVSAQKRFNTALDQVSAMQSQLLASEDHRKELETGIDVIQNTLRRTIKERDEARAQIAALKTSLAKATGADHTVAGRAEDVAATLDILSSQLAQTANARDSAKRDEAMANAAADRAEMNRRLLQQRDNLIFTRLEKAVSTSMKPLESIFKHVGIDPKRVLAEIQTGIAGNGAAFQPLSVPADNRQGSLEIDRANGVLKSLRDLNTYQTAERSLPIGLPLKTHFVYTSPFGYRKDPFTGQSDFHPGQDMGAAYGTPIYSTSDGVVVMAQWYYGYGRAVMIQDAFGLKTLYGHMSQIRVHQGQRVSRGDRIGDMGSSGRSTGTHLHYEIRVADKPVNPMKYIKAATNVF